MTCSNNANLTYGIHPMFKAAVTPRTVPLLPMVPVRDRTVNQEAMLLGFLAEKSLCFTLAQPIIDLSKELASDPKALNALSMDRNTASYKMRFGLAKTLQDELFEDLRNSFFSLNIDEATSDNKQRVLGVLVSYFSTSLNKVVIRHLASVSVIRVNAVSLQETLVSLLETHRLSWRNVMSILMDSCNVMRGSKNGLEVKLRSDQAPHLLDIDGDTCHHAHNAAKKFSGKFDRHVESVFIHINTDFKWSTDLRELLIELCSLLNITFTMPERYSDTRWLSVYDVAVDTLRLMDVYTLFYHPFLQTMDRTHYLHLCVEIFRRHNLDEEARDAVRDIQKTLRAKKMTPDGKRRKEVVTEALFVERKYTRLILHFYSSVLPLLKKYVLIFQIREPLLHRLRDEQLLLMKDFMGCFVKPELLLNVSGKKICKIDLEADASLLKKKDMFIGPQAQRLLKECRRSNSKATSFLDHVKDAYVATGIYLQKKMPVNNILLKHLSALDPAVRGHSPAMQYMKALPDLAPNVLDDEDLQTYALDVQRFHIDGSLPIASTDTRLDSWWAQVFDTGKFPALSKMVSALLSCFHGPQIEGSFSIMGNVITTQTACMGVKTLDAIQSVKYSLKASEKAAVQYFKKNDHLHSSVDSKLVCNMTCAHKRYHAELDIVKEQRDAKKARLHIAKEKAQTKKDSKEVNINAARKARKVHRKALLTKLAKRRKSGFSGSK